MLRKKKWRRNCKRHAWFFGMTVPRILFQVVGSRQSVIATHSKYFLHSIWQKCFYFGSINSYTSTPGFIRTMSHKFIVKRLNMLVRLIFQAWVLNCSFSTISKCLHCYLFVLKFIRNFLLYFDVVVFVHFPFDDVWTPLI